MICYSPLDKRLFDFFNLTSCNLEVGTVWLFLCHIVPVVKPCQSEIQDFVSSGTYNDVMSFNDSNENRIPLCFVCHLWFRYFMLCVSLGVSSILIAIYFLCKLEASYLLCDILMWFHL